MHQPKYSILIPTRNGIKYLPFAIESVLSQTEDNFELIVSVNHSTDGTWEFLQSLTDDRLKVVRPEQALSMSKHFEFLLAQATGEWVTILGDDDGLMPYFFKQLDKLLTAYPLATAISSQRAYYFWNGMQSIHGPVVLNYSGSYRKSLKSGLTNTLQMIFALLGSITYFELPQLYTTGIFHRSLIQKIKERSGDGNFFHSITPDSYAAVACALTVDYYLRTELPLFWVGTSPKSNGFAQSKFTTIGSSQANAATPDQVDEQNKIADDFFNLAKKDDLQINQRVSKKLTLKLMNMSLFLFESLISCPFASRFWKSKYVEYAVYAGILVNLLKDKSLGVPQANENLTVFLEESKKIGLNYAFIILFFIPVFAFRLSAKISKKTFAILHKRLAIFFPVYRKIQFSSTDRESFPDLMSASKEILRVIHSRQELGTNFV